MKSNKIYKGLFLSGCLAVMSMTTSCEDFLTIHPSGQITEEESGRIKPTCKACWQVAISNSATKKWYRVM